MKHFLFLLSFLCCTFIFAQNKSFYKQTYFSSRIEKVLPLPNGQMAYLSVEDDITSYNKTHGRLFVGILDSNFKEINQFNINPPSFMKELLTWRVFENIGKDSLLIGAETKTCDVNNTKAAAVILNIKTGKFSDFEPDILKTSIGLSTVKNGTVLILDKAEGGFYAFKNDDLTGVIPILNAAKTENYTYFGGNTKFYYFSGNDLNSVNTNGDNGKMVFQLPDSLQKEFNAKATFLEIKEDEKFAFWNGKKLRFIDSKGKIVKSFSSSENYLGVYFSTAKNLIFATSKTKMMTFDTDFNLLKTEKIEGDRDFLARGFFEIKNTLYLCGGTVHLPQKAKFNFTLSESSLTTVATIRPFTYNKPKNDVAIENITYQNNPPKIVKTHDILGIPGSRYDINLGNISVKITNTGSDTIKSVSINTQHECFYIICPWDIHNNWDFDKLKLAPGESTIVTLPNVTVGSIPKIANDKFCFWVSNVNNKPDANPDNDYSCAPFAITVATNDIVENDGHTKVFPNPTSDELTINSDKNPIQNVTIFDVAGRKVFSQTIDNQMNVSFSVASFQKGMYLVLVKNAEGRTVHKIVKED